MLGRHTDVFCEDGDCADDFGGTEETAILKGCQDILHLLVPANGTHYAVKILRKDIPTIHAQGASLEVPTIIRKVS